MIIPLLIGLLLLVVGKGTTNINIRLKCKILRRAKQSYLF
jgi:hypothetical protein